jgi:DNA-binding NarL/FixJ family response regulator
MSTSTPPLNQPIQVRALLVCRRPESIDDLYRHMQLMPIQVELSSSPESAIRELCRRKFEAVFVDLSMGDTGVQLLKKLRDLTSNKHAISFAIVEGDQHAATGFRAHANFVLKLPFSAGSTERVLRAAFPLMHREARRYYRHQIEVRTFVKRVQEPEFPATSANISETGMAVMTSIPLSPGERVSVRVELPGFGGEFTVRAEVCWNGNGRAGLRFVNMAPNSVECLKTWIAERVSARPSRDTQTQVGNECTNSST